MVSESYSTHGLVQIANGTESWLNWKQPRLPWRLRKNSYSSPFRRHWKRPWTCGHLSLWLWTCPGILAPPLWCTRNSWACMMWSSSLSQANQKTVEAHDLQLGGVLRHWSMVTLNQGLVSLRPRNLHALFRLCHRNKPWMQNDVAKFNIENTFSWT